MAVTIRKTPTAAPAPATASIARRQPTKFAFARTRRFAFTRATSMDIKG